MKPIYRDLLVLLIVALLGGVIGWVIKPCPTCIGTVSVSVTDSTAPTKDTGVVAIHSKPKLKETRKYKGNSNQISKPNEINTFAEKADTLGFSSQINFCLDTNIYHQDTFLVDNFRAQTTAIITGNELIALNVSYQNLKPEKWKVLSKTVTVEKKQSLVKVYTGIYAGVSIANKTVASYHGGVGLDAIISDMHLIGFQCGLNSSLHPEVGVRFSEKIRLKK